MTKQWSDELTAFNRAFAGAAIFGIPLVFTMEMWWIGKTLSLTQLMIAMAVGLLANLGLAYVAGFRADHSLAMAVDQAVDATAVGLVGAAALLITLNQLRITDGFEHGTGMVMLLSIPLSLGASVARQVFRNRGSKSLNGESDSKLSAWQGVLSDVGATVIGGIFIGISIAPTDEVVMIAAGMTQPHLFAMILVSLLLSYLIVFASGFDESSPPGPFQHPIVETMLAYTISLIVAFAMLLMLDRMTLDDPLTEIIRQTVVFALPVTIGGAGGRLVI